MELSQEARPADGEASQPSAIIDTLRDDIASLIGLLPDAKAGAANDIVQHLIDTGHVIPGAPPAAQILEDAKSFAGRLVLSNLALRILNMLAWSNVETPETKPARKWLEDYLEGRNHGPVGQPMLWPGRLPGLANLLRQWGFVPTIGRPGQPSYVARAVAPPTKQ